MSESKKIIEGKDVYWVNETGLYHRTDGPAVEYGSGTKKWLINGKLHREDGPAVEYNDGDKEWYQYGKRHRVDGPAIEYSDGDSTWYLNGKYFPSKEKWFKALPKEEQIDYLFNMEGNK